MQHFQWANCCHGFVLKVMHYNFNSELDNVRERWWGGVGVGWWWWWWWGIQRKHVIWGGGGVVGFNENTQLYGPCMVVPQKWAKFWTANQQVIPDSFGSTNHQIWVNLWWTIMLMWEGLLSLANTIAPGWVTNVRLVKNYTNQYISLLSD